MNIEELSKMTESELRTRANVCLERLETESAMEREHHVAEAQFYLAEIRRRRQREERAEDAQIAHRDYKLEVWVIVLIGLEILLSIAGLIMSHVEAGNQTVVLNGLKTDLDNLNISSSNTAVTLASLATAQDSTLATEKQNATTISSMNSAMQNQLNILRQDQQQRLKELAKKPILRLLSGNIPIDSLSERPLLAKELTATNATYEFVLTNIGDTNGRNFFVHIGTDNKNVTLSTDNGSQKLLIPSDQNVVNAISVPLQIMVSSGKLVLVVKCQYPAGTKPFNIIFWANGENVPNVSLGSIKVTPPALSFP
jgi:hypothetical protein